MNIVVLAGGLSPERDVSLSGGSLACNAFLELGHKALLIDLFFGLDSVPSEPKSLFDAAKPVPERMVPSHSPNLEAVRALRQGPAYSEDIGPGVIELCKAADIVYMALHGDSGENGKLQALFDTLGIRYTGTGAEGCALAMDKWRTKQRLCEVGVPTAGGVFMERNAPLPNITLPCVVKPCCGGSSIGISIVNSEEELKAALDLAFSLEDSVVVEEYIAGRELSCGVLDGEALPVIELIPLNGFYDYANKYQPGAVLEVTPAELDSITTKRVQELSVKAFSALGLEVYARMDWMLSKDGECYCLEANTLPGMTPTSLLPQEAAAVGIDYPALCRRIVELSLKKQSPKPE